MHRKTLIDDHAKWSELACLFFWERPAFLALFFFFSLHHRSPMGENMEFLTVPGKCPSWRKDGVETSRCLFSCVETTEKGRKTHPVAQRRSV